MHSGNIETVTTKEKAKFPQEFFPECKWSRKGFLRTRWNISGTVFDLINIHLFHDASNFIAMETVMKFFALVAFLNFSEEPLTTSRAHQKFADYMAVLNRKENCNLDSLSLCRESKNVKHDSKHFLTHLFKIVDDDHLWFIILTHHLSSRKMMQNINAV